MEFFVTFIYQGRGKEGCEWRVAVNILHAQRERLTVSFLRAGMNYGEVTLKPHKDVQRFWEAG